MSNIVNLFIPCCMDLFIPSTANTVMSILKKLDVECKYEPEATCCGRQFYFRGEKEAARDLGYNFINLFKGGKEMGGDNVIRYPIVIPSTDCAGYIKKYFSDLFATAALPDDVKFVTRETYELCDYIVNKKGVTCLDNSFPNSVFYFESCSSRNLYKSGDEARILLQNTKGLTLIEDPDMKICCSAHSSFALHNQELSEYLLKMIVDKIVEKNAQFITSTDAHCLQFIDAYLQTREDVNIEVIPLPEILNAQK